MSGATVPEPQSGPSIRNGVVEPFVALYLLCSALAIGLTFIPSDVIFTVSPWAIAIYMALIAAFLCKHDLARKALALIGFLEAVATVIAAGPVMGIAPALVVVLNFAGAALLLSGRMRRFTA